MYRVNTLFLASVITLAACSKSSAPASTATPVVVTPVAPILAANFAKGADISWTTQLEANSYKFYSTAGVQEDVMQVLKDKGMNSIRLRVWVNPADGWCNKADVLAKALRAKALGMRILIDFHYSDSWADPGKQTKPATWVGQIITLLDSSVTAHTTDVLTTLKGSGIVPEWVQVGNETNDGMLWEEGRASTNMANFASLITAGYTAVKAVDPATKVMVHISNGFDNGLFRYMFDGLKTNGAKYDVIGMSLYPTTANWTTLDAQCLINMNDMVSRYGKQVMVCEVGFDVNSPAVAKSFLTDIITRVNSVSGGNGLGVFYWEPECYNNWQNYTLGAFDNTGKPTIAMDAFLLQ